MPSVAEGRALASIQRSVVNAVLRPMILAFSEDGYLRLHSDEREACTEYEGIDVLSEVFTFYDDQGRWLEPVFDVPVKEKRFLWFFRTLDAGSYHLESGSAPDQEPLWIALDECVHMEPDEHFRSLDELKAYLRKRGVQVDPPCKAR